MQIVTIHVYSGGVCLMCNSHLAMFATGALFLAAPAGLRLPKSYGASLASAHFFDLQRQRDSIQDLLELEVWIRKVYGGCKAPYSEEGRIRKLFGHGKALPHPTPNTEALLKQF